MRDELASAIRERTGLDEAMAQQVAGVALEFIKERVPPELAPLLDGQPPDLGGLGGALGGLFGKR